MMRGSIVKRSSGYYVVVELPADETGKRRQKWHKAGPTEADAERLLPELVLQVQRGMYVANARTSLADYLTKTWLPAARATVKPSTFELYETIVATYIDPHIGSLRVQQVKGSHLNELYAKLAESGRKNGTPLAAKTIRNVHTLLHRAFRDGMKWDMLTRNPADAADPPKVTRPQPRYWNAEQVAAFLAATADDRLGPLWVTIATTGCRRGEALAFRWSDLNLDTGTASISRTLSWVRKAPTFTEPKSAASVRTVPLPAQTVAVLREQHRRQATERLAAGELWHDLGLVFAQEDGRPIPPKRISYTFRRAVERAGLPYLSPHGLRHTFATVALEAGVLTKVVADVLGHSSATITADLYSHTTEPSTREASDRVASAMFDRARVIAAF
jgi:integrase